VFVFGAGHDVIPVVQLSRALGWNVVLCAKRARTAMLDGIAITDEVVIGPPAAIADRLAGADRAYAIVMNHSLDEDRECLAMLLDARIDYIGVLGPRRRTEQLLASLGRTDRDPRLHSPVGLELGAETAAEIALAIAGEIQATIAGASAARLRDRPQAIHHPLTAASLV
jgi:xanthine/CO dehydrogenase XdhC/CoxF family maturation factor